MQKSHSLMCALKEVYREIYRFEKELRKFSGLSVNEVMVLCFVRENSSNSGDLAGELSLSPGRMSRILDSLENKNYIVRSFGEKDRRVINVTITAQGSACLDKVRDAELEMPVFLKYYMQGESK